MCAIGGFSFLVLVIAFAGGALTIPALKLAWAKIKAKWQNRTP